MFIRFSMGFYIPLKSK